MAFSYSLGYQESISVHPTRRQIFAGKPDSTFPNIWEWLISRSFATQTFIKIWFLEIFKIVFFFQLVFRVFAIYIKVKEDFSAGVIEFWGYSVNSHFYVRQISTLILRHTFGPKLRSANPASVLYQAEFLASCTLIAPPRAQHQHCCWIWGPYYGPFFEIMISPQQ